MSNKNIAIIIGLVVLIGCIITGVIILMNDNNDTTTINPVNEQAEDAASDPVSINMNLGSGALTTGTLTTGKFCIGSTCIDESQLKILNGGTIYLHNLSGGKGPLRRKHQEDDVGLWDSYPGNASWKIGLTL